MNLLLLTDEMHRTGEMSDTRFTKKAEPGRRSQIDGLLARPEPLIQPIVFSFPELDGPC